MRVEELPGRPCSVSAALNLIGEKWSLLAVREIVFGNKRFEAIARNTGAPRDRLAARLRALEAGGVIVRRQYSEHPPRYEYVLTEAGKDLRPVIMSLKHWGDTYVAHDHLSPVMRHTCGSVFEPRMACAACGEVIADPRTLTRVDAQVDAASA